MDKTFCDIEFLKNLYASNIAPKLLHLKIYKRHLQPTVHVRELQRKHLVKELSSKGHHLKDFQHALTNALKTLETSISKLTLAP